MERAAIDKVCSTVYRQYPIVSGSKPKVSKQSDDRFLLVFSASGKTPDGKPIQHKIRIVASQDGKILKTSMSR